MATLNDIQQHIMRNQSIQSDSGNNDDVSPPFRRIDGSLSSTVAGGDATDYEEGVVSGYAVQPPVLQKPSGFVPPNHNFNDNIYDSTIENIPHQQIIAGNKAGLALQTH